MGQVRGSNIITDGLIYGYDNGHNPSVTGLDSQPHHNDYRFYKGIPATNVISSGIPGYFGSGGVTSNQKTMYGFSSASGVFQRNFVNNPAQANTSTYNNNAGLFHSGLSFKSLSASTEYIMISFDFYMITPYVRHSSSGTGLNGYLGVTYTNGSGNNHGWNTSLAGNAGDDWNNNSAYVGKWRKIALIADLTNSLTPSSINAMYIYNDRTVQGEGIFTNFVITEHTTLPTAPAQWVPQNGSRSNTACLHDLTRTRDISVANMSFDSTGQPTFDGTDDKISTGITTQLNEFSCVVVFKNNSSTAWGRIVDKSYTTGFFISPTWNGNASHVGAGVREPNAPHGQHLSYDNTKYNYFAVTRDGSTHTIYLNGSSNTSQKTNGDSSTLSSTQMCIGSWYDNRSSQRFTGEIPVVKLYNKELSAAEIQQDFEAYKNRFNL